MDGVPLKAGMASAVLAVVLSLILVPQFKSANPRDTDVVLQVMGGTADFAADEAFQEADLYFHAGVRLRCNDIEGREDHCDDSAAAHEAAQSHSGLPLAGWVSNMQNAEAPKLHRHLQGSESREILPWFVVATRLNPHHIEAWTTGAYWFYRSGDARRAEEFASEGVRNNPRDYRVHFDRGVLYYRERKWDQAIRDLEASLGLWKTINEDSIYDLKSIRRYLSYARGRRRV